MKQSYRSFRMWVDGVPVAQGSMRSPRAGVVLHDSKRLAGWRDLVAWTAKQEMFPGEPLFDQPVHLTVAFVFDRPKRPRHPLWTDTAPDLDKLIRAVGDALQGVVLKNDSRIVMVSAQKKWVGEPPLSRPTPGVYVSVESVGWE